MGFSLSNICFSLFVIGKWKWKTQLVFDPQETVIIDFIPHKKCISNVNKYYVWQSIYFHIICSYWYLGWT